MTVPSDCDVICSNRLYDRDVIRDFRLRFIKRAVGLYDVFQDSCRLGFVTINATYKYWLFVPDRKRSGVFVGNTRVEAVNGFMKFY